MIKEQKPPIEIVPWVYFNDPKAKEDIKKMAESVDSIMEFSGKIRETYKMSISDALVVAKKFFNK